MANQTSPPLETEAAARLIGRRAENLYRTRQLFCSEAVLYVINRALAGGLADEAAIGLGSSLAYGMGGAGCTCGALSGAQMALGLFLGRDRLAGPGVKSAQAAGREMQARFQAGHGSSCCRVLSKKLEDDKKALFDHCAMLTGWAAAETARMILFARPELVERADPAFLTAKESKAGVGLRRLADLVRRR